MAIFDKRSPSENVHHVIPSDTVELREVLAKLWAGKRLILAATLLGAGLAFAIAKLITPTYSSSAYVMIKSQSPSGPTGELSAQAGIPVAPEAVAPEAVQTQAFALQSSALVSETIERLHLDRDPEFNPLLRKPNRLLILLDPVLMWFEGVRSRLEPLMESLFGADEQAARDNE